jgi:hypothetical protein
MNGSNKIGIGLASGSVTLDSATVTSGAVTVSGVGFLQDENGTYISTGVWNGGVTVKNYLISQETISDACDSAISDAALATAANLATIDTVVDAIKAKTDSLTFTTAGKVDANVKAVNDCNVAGTGTTGDLWRPE